MFVFVPIVMLHPLKFNSEFSPEKWWLEDKPFLLGKVTFSGENSLLNFRNYGFRGCIKKTSACLGGSWSNATQYIPPVNGWGEMDHLEQ